MAIHIYAYDRGVCVTVLPPLSASVGESRNSSENEDKCLKVSQWCVCLCGVTCHALSQILRGNYTFSMVLVDLCLQLRYVISMLTDCSNFFPFYSVFFCLFCLILVASRNRIKDNLGHLTGGSGGG
jgi:hypothetical protein